MFRPTKASEAARDRQTYIPPDIEKALSAHMDQTLPGHLKQYQGGETFVPQRAENEMAKHLEKSLPGHLKQYAGAYVQQRVIQPSAASAGPSPAGTIVSPQQPPPHAPTTQFSPQQAPAPQGPLKDYAPAAGQVDEARTAPDQPYSFITNPEQPAKQPLAAMLPGGGKSPVIRALLVFGGLVVLFIIFGVFKSLLSGGSADLTPFVGLAQDQQELIHLAVNAAQQPNLTTGDQNLAATMQLSLTTSQANVINYLATNHKKVNEKLLDLKISLTTDNQLTAAAAATTYDETFQQIVQTKLTAYGTALQQAYNLDKGQKGRALVADSYHQAQLLQIQLTAAIGN